MSSRTEWQTYDEHRRRRKGGPAKSFAKRCGGIGPKASVPHGLSGLTGPRKQVLVRQFRLVRRQPHSPFSADRAEARLPDRPRQGTASLVITRPKPRRPAESLAVG